MDSPLVLPLVARRVTRRSLAADGQFSSSSSMELPGELRDAVEIRQQRFLVGRACARDALSLLDRALASTPVGRSPRGVPTWPAGVTGSITHCGDLSSAAVAWSHDALSIGIDSERIMSTTQAGNVSVLIAWPSELAHWRAAGLDRLQALTLVFSAKESIFKCLFPLVGHVFDFHDVRVVAVDGPRRTFRARVAKSLSSTFQAGTFLDGRFDVGANVAHTGITLPPAPGTYPPASTN